MNILPIQIEETGTDNFGGLARIHELYRISPVALRKEGPKSLGSSRVVDALIKCSFCLAEQWGGYVNERIVVVHRIASRIAVDGKPEAVMPLRRFAALSLAQCDLVKNPVPAPRRPARIFPQLSATAVQNALALVLIER